MRLRRGTILVAVLLVVVISALAGTTAMYYGEAAAAGSQVSLKRTRSRAMAWSGVQAVMAELENQREKLLDGEAPQVTTEWQLFEAGGRRGIVRLVALEKDEHGLERWAVSENAKLDLNAATGEMLGKLAALGTDKGAAVAAAKEKGFGSVEELVRVAGMGAILEEGNATNGTYATNGTNEGELRLGQLVTVFSFDPNVQAGIDPGGADARGKLRVNLNTPWSEELGAAIRDRFGVEAMNSAKAMFEAGDTFKTMADVVGALKRQGLAVSAWPAILDAFTVSPDPFIPGRVDINRAPAQVLRAIPGISVDAAEEMVRRRASLDSGVRQSIVWPLSEGILKEEEFIKAADWMSTRSMQWRVRVETGLVDLEGGESAREATELDELMVLEAVIDVGSVRPRVAYLRDVTLMDAAGVMKERLTEEADRVAPGERELSAPAAASESGKPEGPNGLDMDAKLKMSAKLNFGSKKEPEAAGSPGASSSSPAPAGSSTEMGPPAPAPAAPPPDPMDRRIGRWTSRVGSGGGASGTEGPKP